MTFQVGLTGGIASGKSSVSALFAAAGFTVIDYDQLARDVVESGSAGLAAIVERFGTGLLKPDGSLDRPALADIVFNDVGALRDLEAITHPRIGELARTKASEGGPITVHDNPLLIEMGTHTAMDLVVVVDAPEDVQIERMVRDRGMTESEAAARIRNQIARAERLTVADIVIDNSGTRSQLELQSQQAIDEIRLAAQTA